MLIGDWISISWPNATAMLTIYWLVKAFWPLTILAAIAVWFWWRRRSSVGARIVAGLAAALWVCSAIPYLYFVGGQIAFAAQVRSRQETLRDATVIAGIRLPAGTLVTHPTAQARNEIASLDLQQEASVYGTPLTGHVDFNNGQPNGFVTLARDAAIGGIPCSSDAQVQLKDGKVDTCTMSRSSIVRGIPCRGEVSLSNGTQCVLSSDYRSFGVTWRAGTQASIDGNGGSFDIMAQPPNLHVVGSPLPSRAIVEFTGGRLYGVNFTINPWRMQGCTINYIAVAYGAAPGKTTGACRLPRGRDGNVVLPPTAFTVNS
ncbi:MAG TPA: hypothetical protein VMT95_05670 [Candidatus Binatia bacterium]|nr:hypothetical protein [Candidatus Binatia bacterium]